ncbi:hypothetical protein CRYO30217_01621 [Parvicella tangerina]|uniref:NADH:ubiquinone oxidoreductase intermediate-associated protein 30 domain-containing protein n=1 Tax=Parvicella tangerina TaxID=2829795 RepID=A0A916JNR8_9FLAO|nr:hypothetical protein CRYO30217_01621 [Parvicella tangerina]
MLAACSTDKPEGYRFNEQSLDDWNIINDRVMGGKSEGDFNLLENGVGAFSGFVSLENNGGFTMVSNRKVAWAVRPDERLRIKLKGDGKEYQFRVRADKGTYYS